MVSSTRPQRRSRTTSSTGARPWWMPSRAHGRADPARHPLDEVRVEARAPAQRRRDRRSPARRRARSGTPRGPGRGCRSGSRRRSAAGCSARPPARRRRGRPARCRTAGSAGRGRSRISSSHDRARLAMLVLVRCDAPAGAVQRRPRRRTAGRPSPRRRHLVISSATRSGTDSGSFQRDRAVDAGTGAGLRVGRHGESRLLLRLRRRSRRNPRCWWAVLDCRTTSRVSQA